MSKRPAAYVSVDLEFTSNDIVRGRILQIGAAYAYTTGTGEVLTKHYFAHLPVSTEAKVNPWVREHLKPALQQSWELASLESDFPPMQRGGGAIGFMTFGAVSDFIRFLQGAGHAWEEATGVKEAKPTLVGHYCAYDFAFLAQYFSALDLENPFLYRMLDIPSMAMGMGINGANHLMPSGEDLVMALGVAPNPNPHNALADAIHQWQVFHSLMVAAGKQQHLAPCPEDG